MGRYRTEIHGHVVEARDDSLGTRQVLVNGRLVERKWLAAWFDQSIAFDLVDERGKVRAIEVRWETKPGSLGLGRQVRMIVDGVDRALLEMVAENRPPGRCGNCGYELRGLTPDNGEVRCPECGRHTAARLVGVE